MKICTKCKEDKELIKFGKRPSNKDGLKHECNDCFNISLRIRRSLFTDEQITEIKRKDKIKRDSRSDIEKQEKNNYCKSWKQNRTEEEKLADKKIVNEQRKEKYHNDINYKLKHVLRGRLNKAIKNNQKSGSAVDDLGCTVEEFNTYIEKQFEPWMNWDNWGNYNKDKLTWQLDHINCLDSFDLENREEFLKAAHCSNYQPLLALDNILKSNKLIEGLWTMMTH